MIRKIIGSRLIATYIPSTSYCNTLLFILKLKEPFRIRYQEVLGILNSRLIAWYFRHKFQISDDDTFPQIMIRDILQFPISIPNKQFPLNRIVTLLLNINTESAAIINKFNTFLKSKFSINNVSRKLQNWHTLEFGAFIKELNKAIKKNNREREKEGLQLVPEPTKKDEFEWMELFEENKKKAVALQQQISATDKEIDQMVYDLYGLTQKEIEIVEKS